MREDRWKDLIKSLERLMPYYSEMNKIMSLGNDEIIRDMAIRNIQNCSSYLDAGTGPGNMAHKVKNKIVALKTYLMDPSFEMLSKNNVEGEKVIGAFEAMPFKEGSFDLITCAFSFRDAIFYDKAAREISRVLKDKGMVLIVDIRKPDNPFLQFIFYLYILIFPIFSSIIVTKGKLIHEYFTLFYTYLEYPTENEIISMFKSKGLTLLESGNRYFGSLFYHLWIKK